MCGGGGGGGVGWLYMQLATPFSLFLLAQCCRNNASQPPPVYQYAVHELNYSMLQLPPLWCFWISTGAIYHLLSQSISMYIHVHVQVHCTSPQVRGVCACECICVCVCVCEFFLIPCMIQHQQLFSLLQQFITSSEPSVPLTSIPSIRFGAGFLARTFARFVKDLVDIAKDIADKKAPQVHACTM